jgi:parvulin-like peptidyl-prolyl isomerase
MEAAFGTVLIVVVIVAAVIAIATFVSLPKVYDQIGRGGLSLRDGPGPSSGDAGARDEEIRQMLDARNARRARQGREPLDVEAELARLQAPSVDPALRDEIRQLVEARNARRARQGKAPLDVEAEIERELRDVGR